MQQRYPDRPSVGDKTQFGVVCRTVKVPHNEESLIVFFDDGCCKAMWVPEETWRDILVSVPQLIESGITLGWLKNDSQAAAFYTRGTLSAQQADAIESELLPFLEGQKPWNALAGVVLAKLRERIVSMRGRRAAQ